MEERSSQGAGEWTDDECRRQRRNSRGNKREKRQQFPHERHHLTLTHNVRVKL